jgi:hypothetical protein
MMGRTHCTAHHTNRTREFFYIYFITILEKIYDPPQILKNYTSAAVAHGGRSRQE